MDDKQIRSILMDGGIDYDSGLRRMMNKTALYYRFLNKFLEDESYKLLIEASEENNAETVFRAAHTLKGVTANLGLERLCQNASSIVEKVRSMGAVPVPEGLLDEDIVQLKESYEAAVQALKAAGI